MQKQFWNEEKTNSSLQTLNSDIAGLVDFVLIGGWAVYFYAGVQKSEDIDIAIGYDSVRFFKKYGISEYGGTNIKYSIINGTTVDLFIEEYADSGLPVPVSVIMREHELFGKIKVVNRELLLILKLHGYFRPDEVKVRKDIVDVVSLLFRADLDLDKVHRYIDKYNIKSRRSTDALLEYLDKGITLWNFITDSKEEYERLRALYKKRVKTALGKQA